MCKSLSSDQSRNDLLQSIASLESEKKEFERQAKEWRVKIEEIEAKETARKECEQRKHKDEVEQLKKHNTALKKELETFLSVNTEV